MFFVIIWILPNMLERIVINCLCIKLVDPPHERTWLTESRIVWNCSAHLPSLCSPANTALELETSFFCLHYDENYFASLHVASESRFSLVYQIQ